MGSGKERRGIALIIVSSLLVLLAVAAASLLSLASGLRQRSAVNIDCETARLLARSGAAYAYSRLTNPFARAEAADDWAFRDDPSTPLESSLNPSYAHGEPYRDLGGDGRFGAADPYADLNANGRYDAWSGRLRGRRGLADATFALKIASAEAKIDINGGTLSMEDADNYKGPDYNDWLTVKERFEIAQDYFYTARGIPAIRNTHSSEAINLLGEMIYDTENIKPPASIMQTGDVLLQTRPPGGYRSLEEARMRVDPAAWEKIGPYLSTQNARPGAVCGKMWTYGPMPNRIDHVQAIDVNAADRLLLQALFLRYTFLSQTHPQLATFIVSREWTERIADFLTANRPFASRYDLFRKLDAAKGTVFPFAVYGLYSFGPTEQEIAVNLVAGLAEGAPGSWERFARYKNPTQSVFPFFSWATYDLPRGTPSGAETRRLRFEDSAAAPLRYVREPYQGWLGNPDYLIYFAQLLPLSLDTGDPFSVSVESLGRIGEAGARRSQMTIHLPSARISNVVESTGQNDFENQKDRIRPWEEADGSPGNNAEEYVRLNSRETRRLEGRVELRGRPEKRRTQTWPEYPLDSFPDYVEGSEFSLPLWQAPGYFPKDHIGDIALMPYAGRLYGGEFLYMPCWEKGQPLRNPSEPRFARDNFANLIPDPPSEYAAAPAPWINTPWNPLLMRRPTTIPVGTEHRWAFKDFPWVDDGGAFQGGTFDYWGMVTSMRLDNGGRRLTISSSSSAVTMTEGSDNYTSVGLYAPYTPHRATLVLGDTNQGSVDGIPDPGLFGVPKKNAFNPNYKVGFSMDSGEDFSGMRGTLGDLGGGVRAFAEHWLPDKIRAASLQDPYFWTSEAHPDVPGIPSYTSPLYVFPAPACLASASWDGFVPAKIRDADPETAPLRVELLMYADEWAAPGTEQVLPLPAEGWRTGGESVDLGKEWSKFHPGDRPPMIRAFKYRVWFDASAMGAPGNETPVFNSIRIAYRGGHALEGMEWR